MKITALNKNHKNLNAKMVEFAGFEMPIQYSGLIDEHNSVRDNCGVFDVSHMGEFIVEGENALNLIQYVSANDASKLKIGDAQYSYFPNYNGGIVDDLLVYKLEDHKYLIVVNASNIDKDWNWISKNNKFNATISNVSDNYSQLAIQGPKTTELIQEFTTKDLKSIQYYKFAIADFCGYKNVIISNTGYTGSGGFEIYCQNHEVENIWNALINKGIQPIGLAARDTLRLEKAFCLYGNDIDDTTSPVSAGLMWVTKFNKDFINKENILLDKEKGTEQYLVGFELIDKGIPRHDYEIVDANENIIGRVTSGTMSPSLNQSIGMGYIKKEYKEIDSEIFIKIRKNNVRAKVVKRPFLI